MISSPGTSATAEAPATVGNVGCGFDVFGLALDAPWDGATAVVSERPGVTIASIGVVPDSPFEIDTTSIPTDAEKNSASIAVAALLEEVAPGRGIELTLRKGLPLSAGLGGSAASAVAAVVAAEAALGLGMAREELLRHAAAGELRGSGSAGGDNIAPALLGGWLLVRSTDPFDVVRFPVPEGLHVALVYPHCEVRTAEARELLGGELSLRRATTQWANTAATVAALYTGDLGLLGRSLVDVVAEPARAKLVPGFRSAQQAALEGGAIACSLSGSGPTVFALCPDATIARDVSLSVAAAFESKGVSRTTRFVSPVSQAGARIVGPS